MATVTIYNGKKQKGSDTSITYKTLYSVKRVINYIFREDKTTEALKGGVYCSPGTAYDEFILTKAMHNKLPPETLSKHNEVVHMSLNFVGQEATPELAKVIAEEFLKHEQFKGFQIAYAVHIDTENVHVHFAVNTVNYETGLRWHIPKGMTSELIDFSNELCRQHGLSSLKDRKRITERAMQSTRHISSGEYRAARDGRSWKAETLYAGLAVKKLAKNKEEFIDIMQTLGYKVIWKDSRKDITYITPQLKKINSDKLGILKKNFFPLTKEALEKQFAINRQVKENDNKFIVQHQDKVSKLINLARKLTVKAPTQFPFQNAIMKSGRIEGQALKDYIMELEKGKGIEWG